MMTLEALTQQAAPSILPRCLLRARLGLFTSSNPSSTHWNQPELCLCVHTAATGDLSVSQGIATLSLWGLAGCSIFQIRENKGLRFTLWQTQGPIRCLCGDRASTKSHRGSLQISGTPSPPGLRFAVGQVTASTNQARQVGCSMKRGDHMLTESQGHKH